MRNLNQETINILLNPWWSALIVFVIGILFSLWFLNTKKESLINYGSHVWIALGVGATFAVLFFNLLNLDLTPNEDGLIDLAPLIRKLASAFSTSLVGIGGSLLYSIVLKWYYDPKKISKNEEWVNKDERELLFELVNSINNISKNNISAQTRNEFIFNRMNSNIKEVKENLLGNVSQLLEKVEASLAKSVLQIGQTAIDESKEMMRTLNKEFQQRLVSLLESNMEILNRSTNNTEAKLGDMTKKMEEHVVNAMESFKNAVNKFETSTKALNENINQIVLTFKETSNSQLSLVSDSIRDYVDISKDGFEEITTDFKTSTSIIKADIGKLSQTYIGSAQSIKSESEKTLNGFNDRLSQVTDEFSDSLNKLNQEIVTNTSKLLSENIEKLEESFHKLETYQTNSQQVLQQTTESFRKTVENYNLINETDGKTLGLLNEQIQRTDDLLKDRKEILEKLSGINELFPELNDYMKSVDLFINKLGHQERNNVLQVIDKVEVNGYKKK